MFLSWGREPEHPAVTGKRVLLPDRSISLFFTFKDWKSKLQSDHKPLEFNRDWFFVLTTLGLTGAVIESFPLDAALWLIDLDWHNCPLVDNIIISAAARCIDSHAHCYADSLLSLEVYSEESVWKMVWKLCSEAKRSNLSYHAWTHH